ncbi:IclR family transcriptional regulator [Pelagicoccus sp. SDUM812003]|uniref:IclR family transcriptional regulator n=1 Tax=Pelagicoccus sp. SDUM812003 TaxID=3041267 RepID=UPI00280E598E|nr:IclR family transcriptional regulator [Pelagicoccus sp. SDUM812003]MDQ8201412.1 IclR family transcriptional regulator [Pelagicoccus sp. SDUM812003]
MKKEEKYAAPALDKGLDILERLSRVGIPQTQQEIAEALGRTHTEIFRMLARLEHRGYIIRDRASGKYELSLKLFHLSHTHSPIELLRRTAIEPLRELADQVGHASHLSIIDGDELLVVAQARSPGPVSLSIAEGSRFPLLTTTSGKLMLASLPHDVREATLNRLKHYTDLSAKKQKELVKSLDELAKAGYAVAPSEITQGVTNVSARVGPEGEHLLATVALSYVSSTIGDSKSDTDFLVSATLEAANKINRAHGL